MNLKDVSYTVPPQQRVSSDCGQQRVQRTPFVLDERNIQGQNRKSSQSHELYLTGQFGVKGGKEGGVLV